MCEMNYYMKNFRHLRYGIVIFVWLLAFICSYIGLVSALIELWGWFNTGSFTAGGMYC